jgi:hypothetical protein
VKFTELTDMLGWVVLLGRPAAGSREGGGGGLAGGDLSDPCTTPHPPENLNPDRHFTVCNLRKYLYIICCPLPTAEALIPMG